MQNLDRVLLALLFGGFVAKLLAFGATFPEALVVLILAAAHYFNQQKLEKKELEQIKKTLDACQDDYKHIEKELADLRNAIAGVKITQGLRNVK